jgi:hypothetical protein
MNRIKITVLTVVLAGLLCAVLSAKLPNTPEIISLDGSWEIIFDPEKKGRDAGLHTNAAFSSVSERREIQVPSCWERIEQDYEGVAFYRRSFDVPGGWTDKVVRLQFDAVNYRAEVWLNDEVVGFHEGGFTPFEFRVDSLLKMGEENSLIVRVEGPIIMSNQVIDGRGRLETPQWRGGITGGIWQSVRLVATGEVYVQDVFIEPRIADDTATLQVKLDYTGIEETVVDLAIDIHEAGDPEGNSAVAEVLGEWKLRPGKNERTWVLPIPEARYWSPDAPHLYTARLRVVRNGEESDHWRHRFGMRELTVRNRDFYLNGSPIYIKAAFFEGLYPSGIAYPDSEDMARKEIRLAKEAGFNMIRPWRKPPPPMWLDLADEMGVLTVGSLAVECMGLPRSTPSLPAMVENELRRSVLRDRNRACVVQWELFNELHRPILKQMMRPMALLARELDPTRLILDESGGWAFGANLYLPYEYEPMKFNDIHTYPGPFINRERYDGFLAIGLTDEERKERGLRGKSPGRNVVPGLMSFVSELGYGSLPDLEENNESFQMSGNSLTPAYRYHRRLAEDQKRMLAESGFDEIYSDFQQFCLDQQAIHGAANKRMIEAVRSNPEVDGFCIHALVGGDWVLGAGLLDLWRNPKSYAYEATKAANQPQILPIRVLPRNVYAERGARLEITGVNDSEALNGELSIEIVSAEGQEVFSKNSNVELARGVSQLVSEELRTGAMDGTYTVRASFISSEGSLVAENSYDFDVFSAGQLARPKQKITVLDPGEVLKPFLNSAGIEFAEFSESPDPELPVFVTGSSSEGSQSDDLATRLHTFIKNGGTAVYIQGAGEGNSGRPSDPINNPLLPLHPRTERARGLWTCIPHLVKDHPIFDGLPSRGMMRDLYENVWAESTLLDLGGEAIVGSVGFEWFSTEHKLGYLGPGASWWGADLALVPFEKGRYLVSQMRLVENLGKDPVADKLLNNIIRFVTN